MPYELALTIDALRLFSYCEVRVARAKRRHAVRLLSRGVSIGGLAEPPDAGIRDSTRVDTGTAVHAAVCGVLPV